MLALITLRPTGTTPPAAPTLIVVPVPTSAKPLAGIPPLDGSYWAPPFAAPSLILPDAAFAPPPGETDISGLPALGDYLTCGVKPDQDLTPSERAKCEEIRAGFYTGSGTLRPPTEEEQALERHFALEKAIQDAPILLPCGGFTDIICIVASALNGFDFKMGSYAGTPRPENPLAEPVHPYRPK